MEKTILNSLLIGVDTTLKQAMQKLSEIGEKILFVTNEHKRLLGTITDGDIRRGIIHGIQLTVPAQEVMNPEFIMVKQSDIDRYKKAKKLMQQYFIEHIPVVDDNGILTEVISWIDYLKAESEGQKIRQTLRTPVVIMAGGKGTRLDPFTKILPKPLIPLGDKPILEYIMERFYAANFSSFIVLINYKKEMIKTYFSENNWPYEITFVEEQEYYGTVGGLFLLRDRLHETFILTNCDTILNGDYHDFLNWHREKQSILTIIGSHKEITIPYGVLKMDDGRFNRLNEKPQFDLFINTGTYVVEPDALHLIHENEYLDMDKFLDRVKTSYQDGIGVYPHWDGWFDVGQWEEYRRSLKYIEE